MTRYSSCNPSFSQFVDDPISLISLQYIIFFDIFLVLLVMNSFTPWFAPCNPCLCWLTGLDGLIHDDPPRDSACSSVLVLFLGNASKKKKLFQNLLPKLSTDPCLLCAVKQFGYGIFRMNLESSSLVQLHSMLTI